MDKTEATVRNMLSAIEAPLYDVGVLSDRGMLPGVDGIPGSAVIERLSLLKYRNARGSHIYIRPSGAHRYTALDDLSAISLARLAADGFTPCAVVETSANNFQAWLKHTAVFPKLLGTFAAQTLAARYDADPSAADWRRFGRLVVNAVPVFIISSFGSHASTLTRNATTRFPGTTQVSCQTSFRQADCFKRLTLNP